MKIGPEVPESANLKVVSKSMATCLYNVILTWNTSRATLLLSTLFRAAERMTVTSVRATCLRYVRMLIIPALDKMGSTHRGQPLTGADVYQFPKVRHILLLYFNEVLIESTNRCLSSCSVYCYRCWNHCISCYHQTGRGAAIRLMRNVWFRWSRFQRLTDRSPYRS